MTVSVLRVVRGVSGIAAHAAAPPGVMTSVGFALLPVSWCEICNVTASTVTPAGTAGVGAESVSVCVEVSVEVTVGDPSSLTAADCGPLVDRCTW